MIQPLEITVEDTCAAVVVGERNASSHPSFKLGINPSVATEYLIYNLENGGLKARVMVSPRKRQTRSRHEHYFVGSHSRPTKYQDVAIIVKGPNHVPNRIEVREYARKLARILDVGEEIANKAPYVEAVSKFIGEGYNTRYRVEIVLGATPQRSGQK